MPAGTARVRVTTLPPASTSAIEMPVTAPAVSSLKSSRTGTAIVGASLTAAMFRSTVLVSLRLPPEPVLPLSLMLTVSVTTPVALAAGL